jgi:oligopeptidase B
MTPTPPIAPRHPVTETRFGDTRIDDYAWLKDEKWQAVMKDPSVLDPEIRAYLIAETAHTDGVLAPVEGLRKRLFDEMKGRIKEDDSSVPSVDGPYSYYVRYAAGGQHPQYCRADAQGQEQVMLNGDVEATGKAFYRVAGCDHSGRSQRLGILHDPYSRPGHGH